MTAAVAASILTAIDAESRIATVTLNRPEKRNALSMALMGELIDALRALGARRDVTVVILAGNGPAFSAGHDIGEMAGRSLDDYRAIFDRCCELMATVQAIPQPVIAMVRGIATAAGCQLAATCDLVVADEAARFGTPGVKIGLFCSTPMVALSRAIGQKRAMQMLLTGVPIDARTAADWGLVNEVVPAERRLLAFEAAIMADCDMGDGGQGHATGQGQATGQRPGRTGAPTDLRAPLTRKG